MNRTLLKEFISNRLDASVNDVTNQEIFNAMDNCVFGSWGDGAYEVVDDGAHGYLMVLAKDKNYEVAKSCESNSSKHYRLSNGTIMLEEDCDATKFLTLIGI